MTDLQEDHEALLEFIYLCPVAIAQLDGDGRIDMMNALGAQIFMQLAGGGDVDAFFGLFDGCAPELRQLAAGLTAERGTICEAYRVNAGQRSASSALPLVLSVTLLKLRADRMMAVVADISRSTALERTAHAAQDHLRAMLDGVRDHAIFSVGLDGLITGWNRSTERIFGYTDAEAIGRRYDFLFGGDDRAEARMTHLVDGARADGWAEDEGWWGRKAHTRFWGNSVLSTLVDEAGAPTGFINVTRDLTRRKRVEDDLLRRATTDALTGMLNRGHFMELAGQELERWRRDHDPFSVVILDADHFKRVNDTYGHSAGDEVLRALARCCRDQVREIDILGRFGGEEFVVLLPSTDAIGARAAAERIRIAVEGLRITRPEGIVRFTVSAGVAEAARGVTDIEDLIRIADGALYEAKRRGRNQSLIAHPEAEPLREAS